MKLIREIRKDIKITCGEDVYRYLKEFREEDREHFIVLGLNNQNKVVYREVVAIGILDACVIHPREVFKKACIMSVSKIIVAHNHPSGATKPSPEDIKTFNKLKKAGKIIDINVLDSIIISYEGYYSEVEGEEWRKKEFRK